MASKAQDIPAIALLNIEIGLIKSIKSPPDEYKAVVKYRKETEKIIEHAVTTTQDIDEYGNKINEKLLAIQEALMKSTEGVQVAIKKTIEKIRNEAQPGSSLKDMHYLTELLTIESMRVNTLTSIKKNLKITEEHLSLEISKERLREALAQCQMTIEKIKSNAKISLVDLEILQGCIDSWEKNKKISYEQEKEQERLRKIQEEKSQKEREERIKRIAEENRKKEEERRKREEEEKIRRQKEEEEKKKQEEEERKKREEEEKIRRQKEEEERKKQEEEEARKRQFAAEEKRKREEQEEEERKKREEEEKIRRQKEEEERKKQEEEEARKRQFAAEEKRKREEQEQKEKQRRLDPNNWKPIIYTRGIDTNTIERSFHEGICCVVIAVPGSIQREDIQCSASDEDRDILPALCHDEKLLSSIITIASQKGRLELEAPMRAFIPHHPIKDENQELAVKVSVNGSDWVKTSVVQTPATSLIDKDLSMTGIELQNYTTAKVVVVASTRSDTLIIDSPGVNHCPNHNKNVKIFIPRDAFEDPTPCNVSVKPVPGHVLSAIENGSDSYKSSSVRSGPIVNLECQNPPKTNIEIDILNSSDEVVEKGEVKRKPFHLYKTNEGPWVIANANLKTKEKFHSVNLPPLKNRYSVQRVDAPYGTDEEQIIRLANNIYIIQ